ncbi:MAG: hypothetical protein K2X93_25955 [Candidatus Obscuribacterales bacterium]|nr:hypothetical protein [Candidatus Obscuribacterales bacterium]
MTLRSIVAQLIQLLADRETARLNWLRLQRERADGIQEARDAHLALDDQVERGYAQLVEMMSNSRRFGLTEFDQLGLDDADRINLRHLLSERLQMQLLARPRPETLQELVPTWRHAMRTLEAARVLDRLQCSSGPDEFPTRIAGFDGKFRTEHPDAWDRAARAYEALFASLCNGVQFTGTPLWNEQGRALRECIRRFREHYDQLGEQLQTMLEELGEGLSVEMSELEPEDRAALRAVMEDGLHRQRQLAPQTKADPRTRVDTLTEEELEAADAEAETWTQPDEDVR